jgi:hypothetical protein
MKKLIYSIFAIFLFSCTSNNEKIVYDIMDEYMEVAYEYSIFFAATWERSNIEPKKLDNLLVKYTGKNYDQLSKLYSDQVPDHKNPLKKLEKKIENLDEELKDMSDDERSEIRNKVERSSKLKLRADKLEKDAEKFEAELMKLSNNQFGASYDNSNLDFEDEDSNISAKSSNNQTNTKDINNDLATQQQTTQQNHYSQETNFPPSNFRGKWSNEGDITATSRLEMEINQIDTKMEGIIKYVEWNQEGEILMSSGICSIRGDIKGGTALIQIFSPKGRLQTEGKLNKDGDYINFALTKSDHFFPKEFMVWKH